MAKKDIILSGVGGQGILSIATVIGWAALDQNLHLKQAEVHGMSQRGGDVQSNLRISTERIWSDLIPKGECDLILSLEPMEALRYLPWLSKGGWIVTNSTPFVNIPNYPPVEEITAELQKIGNVITRITFFFCCVSFHKIEERDLYSQAPNHLHFTVPIVGCL